MQELPKKKILVLDDEPYVCDYIEGLLKDRYEVITANDGKTGLALINKERPDLIILDLVMPELSGYALLDILNAQGNRVPVLVISPISQISENLAHQGIAGLLIKPIDPERLLVHIDAIFKIQSAAERIVTSVDEVWKEEERSIDEITPQSLVPPPDVAGTVVGGEEKPAAAPPPPPPVAEAKGPKPLVLVVEDEPDMQRLLVDLLSYSGYEAIAASDGQEGLAIAQERLPNAIVLDIMLPKMDGFQVARLLKFNEKYRDIPIVVLTARTQPADRDIAIASGADAYITKPFDVSHLLETLKKVILEQAKAKERAAR